MMVMHSGKGQENGDPKKTMESSHFKFFSYEMSCLEFLSLLEVAGKCCTGTLMV